MDMADIVIHINENTDHDQRVALADKVRAHDGVMSADLHDEKPHLMIVEFNPEQVHAKDLLQVVLGEGVHAQLVGL